MKILPRTIFITLTFKMIKNIGLEELYLSNMIIKLQVI